MVVIAVGIMVSPVSADMLSDKTQELTRIQKQIAEQQKKLDSIRKQKATLKNQIDLISEQITASQLQLEALSQQISLTTSNLTQINTDLVDSEMQMYEQERILREAIKESYMRNRLGILEVVLGSDDLSSFVSQLEYVSTIEGRISHSLKSLQDLGDVLRKKKVDLEVADKQLKELQGAKELEQHSLEVQNQSKAAILENTTLTEAEYQKRLQQSIAEQSRLNSEVAGLARNSRGTAINPDGVKLMWPIPARKVSAGFRDADYAARFRIPHLAIDIPTPQGTPIKAPANAYVSKVRFPGDTSYSYIVLDHGGPAKIVTVYGHVSCVNVSVGQFVTVGTVIGCTGAAPGSIGAGGLTTGPHLHFEVWSNGEARNPLSYLVG